MFLYIFKHSRKNSQYKWTKILILKIHCENGEFYFDILQAFLRYQLKYYSPTVTHGKTFVTKFVYCDYSVDSIKRTIHLAFHGLFKLADCMRSMRTNISSKNPFLTDQMMNFVTLVSELFFIPGNFFDELFQRIVSTNCFDELFWGIPIF